MSKTMTTRFLGVVGAAAILALGAFGCKQPQDPNSIRFRYWGDTEEVNIIEGLLADFEKANPGVTIHPERKNSDGTYADVLLTEFASNTAPDVIFVSTDNFDVLADSGKLANLNPWIAKTPSVKINDYYPFIIKRFSKNGQLMVLPRDVA
ncbi:MAG: extracellular solute-binding protein, partial [bacterium]